MKTILTLFLFMACCVSAISATAVFPASTNGFNTFTGTNAFMNTVGIGTAAPNHKLHVVSTTNDVVGIDSTGVDSASMLHIKNTGPQGPFFDFWASPGRYGYGVASGGSFNIRHSAVGTDPVNGTTIFTLDPVGNVSALAGFAGNGGVNATTIGLTNLTTTTNTIYVELTGNDVTGDGTYAHPYKTIMKACSATNASTFNGLTVRLGPGHFDYVSLDAINCAATEQYDGIKVPYNGALIGSGMDKTFITSSNCNDSSVIVTMQENGLLADLTVDCWSVNPLAVYTAGIGVGGNQSTTLNSVVVTNMFMRNVRIFGAGDCFINGNDNITNAVFEGCQFYSHWDGVTIRSQQLPDVRIRFLNCYFWSDSTLGAAQFVGPQLVGETGIWTFDNCQFVDPSGNCTQVFAPINCTNNVYGCTLESTNNGRAFTMAAGSVINVVGGNFETGGYSSASVAGKFITTPPKVVPQVTLSAAFTNQVPRSDATHTNWVILSTNGIPLLVATNFNNSPVGQAFFIKVLVP